MRKSLSLVCIAVGIICCFSASAQSGMFVKISGINGTSLTNGFTAYSEVLKTGLENTTCYVSGGGTNTCNAIPGNFNFQLYVSEVLPQLQARLFQSTVIPTIDFVFTKASGTAGTSFVYYQIHMEDVRIASIAEVSNSGEPPTEQVGLAFRRIAWKYTPQTNTGGAGTPVYGCYNSVGATGTGSSCTYTFPY